MQRLGLGLMWLLGVLGGEYRALATQNLPAAVAQPFPDTVIGPAALAHVGVGMRMDVRVMGGPSLGVISRVTDVLLFVCVHTNSVTCSPSGHQGRKSRETGGLPLIVGTGSLTCSDQATG